MFLPSPCAEPLQGAEEAEKGGILVNVGIGFSAPAILCSLMIRYLPGKKLILIPTLDIWITTNDGI